MRTYGSLCRDVTSALVGALAIAGNGGCNHPGVDRLTATPTSACASSRVRVHWDLTGEGTLTATPKPPGWADGVVTSSGDRDVNVVVATDFFVTVPKAAPERRDRSAHVAYLSSPEVQDRLGQANCEPDGKVRAIVNMSDVEEDVRAVSISVPETQHRGHRDPAQLCVSHLAQRACVSPGASQAFAVPARGQWVLELDRAPDTSCADTPSQLRIHVDFACPASAGAEEK